MADFVNLTALIPRDLNLAIEKEAHQKGTTVSGIVQVALKSYFGEDKPEYPRLFKVPNVDIIYEERIIENEEELIDYLLVFAKKWYHPGVIGPPVLRKIAELSSPWDRLEIRFAEDLLLTAGQIAEALEDDKITIQHVEMAYRYWIPMCAEKTL
ncbi:MAG: hypothetical protein JSV56_04480 [Methanomassiliicoccales archaeon]|nr:MAG: hypothetical protein JSV56_04480 [Methanomassiliicoccales archaeon]